MLALLHVSFSLILLKNRDELNDNKNNRTRNLQDETKKKRLISMIFLRLNYRYETNYTKLLCSNGGNN